MTYRLLIAVATLLGFFQASAVHAQATRTWVSGVGDDANPCSRTAPCKTFAGAISKTAAGGEINPLDSGGFGAVTITKSISIVAEGVIGGILAAGTNGIIVNAPANSVVFLQGLDIDGVGTGINSIRMIGAGKLTVRNTTIRDFTGNGIDVQGGAGARVVVDNLSITNTTVGILVKGVAGVANNAIIKNSLIDANATSAVQVENGSTVILAGNSLSGSGGSADLNRIGTGAAISYGNNLIRSGTPSQTLPLQ